MTDNKTARATISYLIARDAAHEAAYAKALETLGVSWGKVLPIPKFDAAKYPEVRSLMDEGAHRTLHHWRVDGSTMSAIFQGASPLSDNGDETLIATDEPPRGGPIPMAPERTEEFAPGLTPELLELADQTARLAKRVTTTAPGGNGSTPQPMREPRELFVSQLADVYYAEKALEKVLPRLAREASDKTLRAGFETHLDETRRHAANLEQIFESLGEKVQAEPCPGIEGLREEHDKFLAEHDPSPAVRDMFLAGAGARTEHYEIAAYGELTTMAQGMGEAKIVKLLQANLRDEQGALRKLETVAKRLAKSSGNGSRQSRSGARAKTKGGAASSSRSRTKTR